MKIVAALIERVFKNWITTVLGVLLGFAAVVGAIYNVIPPTLIWHGYAVGNTLLAAAGVAVALAGAIAKDKSIGINPPTLPTAKLGAWMLIAVLVMGTMPVVGCNGSTVAQSIVNWTPTLQSTVATVDSSVSLLLPADAAILTAATVGFDAASNLVVAQAKAYLANPSATVLAQLQAAIVTLEQTVTAATLSAAKITNSASQQHALAAIGAVGTVVTAILSLVQSISSKAAVAKMSSQSTLKLAAVQPFVDWDQVAVIVAQHNGSARWADDRAIAKAEAQYTVAQLERAGF